MNTQQLTDLIRYVTTSADVTPTERGAYAPALAHEALEHLDRLDARSDVATQLLAVTLGLTRRVAQAYDRYEIEGKQQVLNAVPPGETARLDLPRILTEDFTLAYHEFGITDSVHKEYYRKHRCALEHALRQNNQQFAVAACNRLTRDRKNLTLAARGQGNDSPSALGLRQALRRLSREYDRAFITI